MSGRFITLEGGEAVGKSTQLQLLSQSLAKSGVPHIVTREPGGTDGAEAIRALLLTGTAERWCAEAETLLFAAARADHVARLIRPALESETWVICDRFVDSTRAYQGGASGIADADILTLHRIGCNGLMPDRTLVLSVPDAEAAERIALRDGSASDRIGGRSADFHARVAARFRAMASEEPGRIRMIDASGDREAVLARIRAALADLLP